MRYLNYWDNKNFRGAKSGPLTHASSVNINLNFLFINNDLISGNGFQCYKCLLNEDCYKNGTVGSVEKCNEGINTCVMYTLEEGKLCPKT